MGSREKKRSKKISQGRKKKGDRVSGKKIVKKLHSYSESDDDFLISVSSSSKNDVVKGRRLRSRARKDVKRNKRRPRSSSYSSDSSSDSSVKVEKIKSSKRKLGLGRKKKDGKKYKRAVSLSSSSSDESDYEKSKKKDTQRRYVKEDKIKRKKKRNKARCISSSSQSSASDYERKRKRYRSPTPSGSSLSTSSESEREGKRKRYWSPSDSSISRGSKSSYRHVQDENDPQNKPIRKLKSIIVVSAAAEPYQNATSEELGHHYDTRDYERSTIPSMVEKDEIIKEKKNTAVALSLVPDNEDLESILRRKALENLKTFRGGSKTSDKFEKMEVSVTGGKQIPMAESSADQENTVGSYMKHSLSFEIGLTQNESDKGRVNVSTSFSKEEVLDTPSIDNSNKSFKKNLKTETGRAKSAQCSEDNRAVNRKANNLNLPTITDKNSYTGDEGVSTHEIISQPSKLSDVKAQSESVLKSRGLLAACSIKDLKSSSQECINSEPVASKGSTDNSSNTQVNEVKATSIVMATVVDTPSSSIPHSTDGDHVSSEHKGEDKEQSQFQEKTMTVMRGGELVQVSYKVYIPKKAPAANRRRLNR